MKTTTKNPFNFNDCEEFSEYGFVSDEVLYSIVDPHMDNCLPVGSIDTGYYTKKHLRRLKKRQQLDNEGFFDFRKHA